MNLKRICRGLVFYLSIGIICILVSFPFFWMITTSLRTDPQIFTAEVQLVSSPVTLVQYQKLFSMVPFLRFFLNSVLVAAATTVFSVVLAMFAGFSLSRFRYRGRSLLAQTVLFLYMIPGVAVIVPLYVVLARLGLVDSLVSLTIMHTTFCLPFSIWMLFNFFDTIPIELENAAMIDGCSKIQSLFRITLPLALPAIAVTAIFSFLLSWNEFMFARTLIISEESKTLPWGLAGLVSRYSIEWGPMMAGATLTMLPVLALFIWIQKYMLAGLTAGAIKQ